MASAARRTSRCDPPPTRPRATSSTSSATLPPQGPSRSSLRRSRARTARARPPSPDRFDDAHRRAERALPALPRAAPATRPSSEPLDEGLITRSALDLRALHRVPRRAVPIPPRGSPGTRCRSAAMASSAAYQTLGWNPGLRARDAAAARELPGQEGRRVHRGGAREDLPRAAPRRARATRRDPAPALLRVGRRDAALRPHLRRDREVDGRSRALARPPARRGARPHLVRHVRRHRQGRLRRVRPRPRRAAESGLEGLGALALRSPTARARSCPPRSSRCRRTSTPRDGPRRPLRARRRHDARGPPARRGDASCSDALRARLLDGGPSGCYAQALDGAKQQVRAVTQQRGPRALVRDRGPDRRRRRAAGSSTPDMYTGWGIRTLSQRLPDLQPDELPQRLGLAARQLAHRAGLRALRAAARRRPRSSSALIEAGALPRRAPPELFCGFERDLRFSVAARRLPRLVHPAGLVGGDGLPLSAGAPRHAAGPRHPRLHPRSRAPAVARAHRRPRHAGLRRARHVPRPPRARPRPRRRRRGASLRPGRPLPLDARRRRVLLVHYTDSVRSSAA